jgi:hypothetical protein
MLYDFSFSRPQLWVASVGIVVLLVLMFASGFTAGALWQRSRPVPPVPAAAQPPGVVPPPAAAQSSTAPAPAPTPEPARAVASPK